MLTKTQTHLLRDGVAHPDGVVRACGRTSFEQSGQRIAVNGLVAQGLIEPNAHGDYYITNAGRCALQAHASETGETERS